MPRFRYKAVSAAGELLQGEVEAPDRDALVARLMSQGHTPIRADEVSGRGLRFDLGGGSKSGPKPRSVSMLTRELATLLQAGLPLDRALSILAEISVDPRSGSFIQQIQKAVHGGQSLADALEAHKEALPPFYIGLVRAGEAGGALDVVLTRLADAMERGQALKDSVRSALYYPAFVLVMSVLTLLVLFVFVVPEFKPLFEDSGRDMPVAMGVLISVGDWIKAYWWLLIAVVVALYLLLRQQARSPTARMNRDRWLLRVPLAGDLIVKVEVARFARTLGTLLANGVTVLNALSITTGTIANRAVAAAIESLSPRLKRGEGLAAPLMETGIVPRLAVQLVQVGEESGQLEAMLLRIADIYDEEVKRSLQRMISLLVPTLTICVGLLVALIIGSMLTAILSTYDLSM